MKTGAFCMLPAVLLALAGCGEDAGGAGGQGGEGDDAGVIDVGDVSGDAADPDTPDTEEPDPCEACTADQVCVEGSCAEPCGVLDEPCPDGFRCTTKGACVNDLSNEAYVPAGSFYLGCNAAKEDPCASNPQTLIEMPAYFIDRTEVTKPAREACAGGGECPPFQQLGEDRPEVNFTWVDAQDYCASIGKTLCSEAQWERAARGGCETVEGDCATSMRTFPWGDEPRGCEVSVVRDDSAGGVGCGSLGTSPVATRRAGVSPYGAHDMVGNVDEWTADCWAPTLDGIPTDGSPRTEGCEGEVAGVLKGGHLRSSAMIPPSLRIPGRAAAVAQSFGGFRCCRAYTDADAWSPRDPKTVVEPEPGDAADVIFAEAGAELPFGDREHTAVGAIDGKLVVVGGRRGGNSMRDGFYTEDGSTWTQIPEGHPPFEFGALAANFQGALWVVGGGSVLRTDDGLTWTDMEAHPTVAGRRSHCLTTFADQLWVIGGGGTNKDVWASSDGVRWTLVVPNDRVPFHFVDDHTCLTFRDRIWVMGGHHSGTNTHQVWSSADGETWEMVTDDVTFGSRVRHAGVVFRDRMWIVGGYGNTGDGVGRARGDLWYSEDGVQWQMPTGESELPEQGDPEATVFDDRIWVAKGRGSMWASDLP
jgi:formylglycine-generating enzyme required for sulfatase activity